MSKKESEFEDFETLFRRGIIPTRIYTRDKAFGFIVKPRSIFFQPKRSKPVKL